MKTLNLVERKYLFVGYAQNLPLFMYFPGPGIGMDPFYSGLFLFRSRLDIKPELKLKNF